MLFPQSKPFDDVWTLVDDFSEAWTVSPDVGTIQGSLTTDYVKVGTASNRMTIGDGSAVTDQGDLNKAFTLNMDNGLGAPRSILLRIYGETGQIDPAGGSFTFRVDFYDSLNNYLRVLMTGVNPGGTPSLVGGGDGRSDQPGPRWNDFKATDEDSTGWSESGTPPDYTDIVRVEIFASRDSAYTGITPHIVTLDSLYYSHEITQTKALFTMCFDDSNAVQRDIADRLSQKWGFQTTVFNIPGRVKGVGGLDRDDLVYMYRQGHEMQVHGGGADYGGLPWTDQADSGAQEIQDAIDLFDQLGVKPSVLHASYPEGKTNSNVIRVLQQKGIKSGRTISAVGYDAGPPVVDQSKQYLQGNTTVSGEITDPWMVQCLNLIAPTTVTPTQQRVKAQEIAQRQIDRGGWTMGFSHGWPFQEDPASGSPDPGFVEFDAFFDWLKSEVDAGNVEFLLYSEAYQRIGSYFQGPLLAPKYPQYQFNVGDAVSIDVTPHWLNAVSWSIPDIPPGLSFNGTTLSGNPTSTGTYSIVVVASDSEGRTSTGAIPMFVGISLQNDTDGVISRTVAAGASTIISTPGSSQVSVNFPPGGTPGVGLVSQYQYIQPDGVLAGQQGGLVQTFDPAANANLGESKNTGSDSNIFVNNNAQPVRITVHPEINLERGA